MVIVAFPKTSYRHQPWTGEIYANEKEAGQEAHKNAGEAQEFGGKKREGIKGQGFFKRL